MHPSRRPCVYASLALFGFLLCAPRTIAETLVITSVPSGATVELDGIVVGTTPYQVKYPGGYFHRTKSVFGDRLQHAMVLRVGKEGYDRQEIQLTEGPFEWTNLHGKNYGHYYLLKSNKIELTLQPLSRKKDGSAAANAVLQTTSNSLGREPASGTPVSVSSAAADPPAGAAPPSEPVPPTGDGRIAIASDQPGAEIYVDGQFVGQTPATIRLPSGAHRIELRMTGRVPWQRDLNVLKDSQVSLHATLTRPE